MVAVVLRVRTEAAAAAIPAVTIQETRTAAVAVATTRETRTVAVAVATIREILTVAAVTDAIPAITAVVTTDADKKGVSFSGCPLFFLKLHKI